MVFLNNLSCPEYKWKRHAASAKNGIPINFADFWIANRIRFRLTNSRNSSRYYAETFGWCDRSRV